jgi:hypothetical protein
MPAERSIKLTVPADTTRDDLLVYARKTIERTLKLSHFEVQSMTSSYSKGEKPGEVTYRIRFVNLLPN